MYQWPDRPLFSSSKQTPMGRRGRPTRRAASAAAGKCRPAGWLAPRDLVDRHRVHGDSVAEISSAVNRACQGRTRRAGACPDRQRAGPGRSPARRASSPPGGAAQAVEAGDAFLQHLHGDLRDRVGVGRDRREAGVGVGGHRDVVPPGDRHVAGHAQPTLLQIARSEPIAARSSRQTRPSKRTPWSSAAPDGLGRVVGRDRPAREAAAHVDALARPLQRLLVAHQSLRRRRGLPDAPRGRRTRCGSCPGR